MHSKTSGNKNDSFLMFVCCEKVYFVSEMNWTKRLNHYLSIFVLFIIEFVVFIDYRIFLLLLNITKHFQGLFVISSRLKYCQIVSAVIIFCCKIYRLVRIIWLVIHDIWYAFLWIVFYSYTCINRYFLIWTLVLFRYF